MRAACTALKAAHALNTLPTQVSSHCCVVFCRTGTETLQLWDWLAATVEDAAGGDTAVADLTEARQMAAAAAGASSAAALFGEVSVTASYE
jgi:hypothetical protein